LAIAGCVVGGAGTGGAAGGLGGGVVGAGDVFAPRTIRVHPLTALELSPPRGAPYINAHIELLDGADDPVKALGELTFILYSGERVGQSLRQIASWPVEAFADPALNARAFDHVTRTYRFRLEGLPDDLDPTEGLVLEAGFRSGGRERISARHTF